MNNKSMCSLGLQLLNSTLHWVQGWMPIRVFPHFSCVWLFVTPSTVSRLSMGFSQQEYLSGLPFPLPGDLPNLRIEPASMTSPALAGGFFTTSTTWKAPGFFNLPISYSLCAAAAAKSRQSCPTLCDPIDGSPPGSPIPGILQARTLEWIAISFSTLYVHLEIIIVPVMMSKGGDAGTAISMVLTHSDSPWSH